MTERLNHSNEVGILTTLLILLRLFFFLAALGLSCACGLVVVVCRLKY